MMEIYLMVVASVMMHAHVAKSEIETMQPAENQQAEIYKCKNFIGLSEEFDVEKDTCNTMCIGYNSTVLSFLRDFLKNDDLVLRAKITKDSMFVPLSDYGSRLESNSKYSVLLPSGERFYIVISGV
jgi:hypothetical protein